jgi:hypothetical protein
MRILIQPAHPAADIAQASDEIHRALEVLEAAHIKTQGGGTIESDGSVTGVLVLRFDDDAAKAIEALARGGIKATIG